MGDLLICTLVESYRNDDGQPRQRKVAYLGSIRQEMPINHRIVFWEDIVRRLDGLNLPLQARNALVERIKARVPYADRDQWQRG